MRWLQSHDVATLSRPKYNIYNGPFVISLVCISGISQAKPRWATHIVRQDLRSLELLERIQPGHIPQQSLSLETLHGSRGLGDTVYSRKHSCSASNLPANGRCSTPPSSRNHVSAGLLLHLGVALAESQLSTGRCTGGHWSSGTRWPCHDQNPPAARLGCNPFRYHILVFNPIRVNGPHKHFQGDYLKIWSLRIWALDSIELHPAAIHWS